jgi:hypothetical protein
MDRRRRRRSSAHGLFPLDRPSLATSWGLVDVPASPMVAPCATGPAARDQEGSLRRSELQFEAPRPGARFSHLGPSGHFSPAGASQPSISRPMPMRDCPTAGSFPRLERASDGEASRALRLRCWPGWVGEASRSEGVDEADEASDDWDDEGNLEGAVSRLLVDAEDFCLHVFGFVGEQGFELWLLITSASSSSGPLL